MNNTRLYVNVFIKNTLSERVRVDSIKHPRFPRLSVCPIADEGHSSSCEMYTSVLLLLPLLVNGLDDASTPLVRYLS